MSNAKVISPWKCDACGAQTTDARQYEQEWFFFSKKTPGKKDSYEQHYVCSVDCFIEQLQESLPALLEYADSGAAIAHMPVRFAQALLERLQESENKEDE